MATSLNNFGMIMDRVTGSAPGPEGSAVQVYASASSDSGDVKLYMKDSSGYESVVGGGFSLEDGDGTELNITGGAQLKFIEGGAIDINWSDVSHGIDGDEYDLTFTLDIQNLSETTTVADGDLVVIDDGAGGTLRKMTRANFIESAALDAINIDGGAIDGTPIGANSESTGKFSTLTTTSNAALSGTLHVTGDSQLQGALDVVGAASFENTIVADSSLTVHGATVLNGNVDLGDAAGDTITANGQFDSDLVPSSDDARDLGSSAKEWKDLYIDGVAYVDSLQADQLGAALDANSQAITNINVDSGNIDGTAIGSNSASTAKVTSLTASLGALFQDSVRIQGDLEVQGAVNTVTNHETELHIADKFILIASGATAANTDGAGILLGDASSPHAKLVWDHGDDRWHTPDGLHVSGSTQFDGNVILGADEDDVITVSGELTASLGLSLPDDKKLYFGTGFDASIEYDEDGTDELRFAGAAVTFEQAVTFDGDVTLGDAAGDVTTVTGKLSGSNGMAISGDAVIIGTTSLSGTVAFVGGYTSNADAGMSFNAANGSLTSRGAFQADGGLTTAGNASVTGNSTFGGGYGSTGVTISTAGNIQANGALTVDTTSTLSGQVTVGGGYGSSGVTLSAAGVVSMDGALTVGSDGAGADFKVFGGAANEYLLYDVSENLLQMADSSGTVLLSIGGDASTEYAIDVADGANNANRIRAASFVTYSDESLKTDVETMDNAVDTIKKLRGVNFTWTKDNTQDFGFIAQEVKNVVPEVVHTDSDGTSGVDYSRLTSILVEAVKEQQQQIDELKNLLDD